MVKQDEVLMQNKLNSQSTDSEGKEKKQNKKELKWD